MVKISQKEKKFLIIFVLCAFVAAVYFLAYIPMKNRIEVLHGEVSETVARIGDYENKQILVNRFENDEKQMYKMQELWLEQTLPRALTYEDIIAVLKEIRTKLPEGSPAVEMSSIQFEENRKEGSNGGNMSTASSAVDQVGVKVGMETAYSSLKEVLNNIANCRPKVTISEMGISFSDKPDAADPNLRVNMTLNFLTYKSTGLKLNKEEDIEKYKPSMNEMPKPNLFTPYEGMSPFALLDNTPLDMVRGTGTGVVRPTNDFYVIVSPVKSDTPSLVLGKKGTASKAIYENKNGTMTADFTFEGKDGKYSYKYSTDTMRYPTKTSTESFEPLFGSAIIIKAVGYKNSNTQDKSGVKINVRNKTDIPVKVVVEDDDPADRRITVNRIEGYVSEEIK